MRAAICRALDRAMRGFCAVLLPALVIGMPPSAAAQQNKLAAAGGSVAAQNAPTPRAQINPLAHDSYVAPDPYARQNGTWITLTGKVTSVRRKTFGLQYGGGMIQVQMKAAQRSADDEKLMRGDDVIVTGLVNDNFIRKKTINPSSVYVRRLHAYFYGNPLAQPGGLQVDMPPQNSEQIILRGTVTAVAKGQFTLNTGLNAIKVAVDMLGYRLQAGRLEGQGQQPISVGDVVAAAGMLDHRFFGGRTLEADSVKMILKHQERRPGSPGETGQAGPHVGHRNNE
ncbi:MAG TPA: OB-fold nucleic acid binding domain-containing protein [Gammaproteobacteria bacterium]|nr:OB-fold nucleic acid binding domain-containing protein [Gammaproteobacteria bacterium]